MFHGIQDLKEGLFGKFILTDVTTALGDVEEKISFRAVLQDDVDAVGVVDDLQHRDDVGVGRGGIVKLDLPGLEGYLATVQRSPIRIVLAEALDGIPDVGGRIDGGINHPVRTSPNNPRELKRGSYEPP